MAGLPVGIHEIKMIERARMRAAWEKEIEPNIKDQKSLCRFRDYLDALERDEWTFRENEINEIQELRLYLLENMLNETHEKSKTRTELKMKNFIEKKEVEKELALKKIRKKTTRELRKLESQQRELVTKYKVSNVIDEYADRKSEIYGPLMRHGEDPKRWHQVIDEKMKTYKAQFIGVERFSTLPSWLDKVTKIQRRKLRPVITQLCIKKSRWTGPVLKQLHQDMINLRKEIVKQPLALRTKVEHEEKICFTPEVQKIPADEEEKYQAAVMLQKVVRGRATQMMIYEGRNTCKELIQELKYSVGLMKQQKEYRTKQRLMVKTQQREECMQINMVQKLQGTLSKLQGSVVGTLLDFLNKELRRLLEERKVHAMCLLNERERFMREAAEAGRRQKELRRRREHDEMFKQIVKITQESVDVYLQDVITEGMEFASREEATDYVTQLANKIEIETNDLYNKMAEQSIDDSEEIIANMVLHFLVPDVEKRLIREVVHSKQKEKLRRVHEVVQTQFKNLPKPLAIDTKIEDEEQNFINDSTDHSSENSSLEMDPIEAYLRNLEKEQEYTEYQFPLVHEDHILDDAEHDLLTLNESLDTIPEVSE